jgi:hypothetical protein
MNHRMASVLLALVIAMLACSNPIQDVQSTQVARLQTERAALWTQTPTIEKAFTATSMREPAVKPTLKATVAEPSFLFKADFNDSAFDGKFDSSQWKPYPSVLYTKIGQKDGVMVFAKTSPSGGENGKLTTVQTWKAAEFRHLEARLKMDSRHTGSNGNMAIIFAPADLLGWWEGCGISLDNPAPFVWCGQGFNNGVDFITQNYPVSYDQWYTVAIDIDPATAMATFFLDGQRLDQWQPGNVSRLINAQYNFSIGPVMQDGTTITGYADDVKLSD